jgi:alkanesulfonate monooxygenase SsuD/methylene tetrahydromethanopterin reductase-like flavin-dependent oxidoreductase (luciferase family)
VNQRVRFGLCTDQNLSWEKTLERWLLFERLGFDSAWDCDHYVQPSRPDGPYFEGWTLLAALAARTETIRAGCWSAATPSGTRRCWPRRR